MPTPTEHFPLPLDLLIGRLEAAGFRVDTSRRLRVLRVFDDLGNPFVGGHFEDLKYLLSPLVSRSPQEQERFYEVFDAFWRECEAEAQQVEEAGDFAEGEKVADEVRVLAKQKKRWRWWVWVLLGLMAFELIFLVVNLEPAIYRGQPLPHRIAEGDTLRGEPILIFWVGFAPDSTPNYLNQTYWEVSDYNGHTVMHRDTGDLTWGVSAKYGSDLLVSYQTGASYLFRDTVLKDTTQVKILCSNPPEVSEITTSAQPPYQPNTEYEFSIKTEPGCRVVWEEINGGSSSDTLTVDATGRSIFRLKTETASKGIALVATVHRPENIGYCYTSKTLNIEIGNDKPILPLTPFQRDQSFSVFVISRLGWLVILLPLLLAGWFFYRWRKKRNTPAPQKTPEELADQYPVLDAGPYFIPYRPQEHSITVPREFFRIAELLRRREEGQRRYFDGPATVRATVESGGFPAWRERAMTRPAEYLFLVERPDERDQQGKLFARLCDFLKRRDVPLVAFFHDGSFQHFWNAEHSDGLPPLELRRRYPHHRLVLLGMAHGLVNPYATRQPELLRGPLDWLTHWPRRLLLTPEPVAAWSFQEALLHRHFLVFPADTEGILSGIDLLDRTEEYHAGRFERWQEGRAPRHSPETHRYRTWKTAAEHADYLRHDPDCFRWLCALAVCAQPDWSLTLALGRAIGAEVTHDRLLLLTRIPWLSQNQPNDGLRLELLRQLSPADEQAARAAVAHELEAVRSVTANSFAETERTANAAVQNFALDPRDEAHKQAIRELRTLGLLSGSQEAELDFIVQEKADKSGLPNSAAAGIEGWLDVPAPKRFWTRDMVLCILSIYLSFCLMAGFYMLISQQKQLPPAFAGLMEDVAQDNELVRLNERAIAIAERLLAVEDYETWSGLRDSVITGRPLSESKIGLQDSVLVVDSLFQLVDKRGGVTVASGFANRSHGNNLGINLHIFRYNVSAKNFNFYQTGYFPADRLRPSVRGFERAAKDSGPESVEEPLKSIKRKLVLDSWHGQGLCYHYLSNLVKILPNLDTIRFGDNFIQASWRDSARLVYHKILRSDSSYFDSIQATMPVNLQTLLEAEGVRDKGDPADTDEAMRQKILGYWVGAVGSWKALTIFGKDGTATMQTYNSANKLMQTASGRWSVENKTLLLEQSDVTKSRITHLDNNRLTLDDGTTKPPTFRRIQPTDRDRDGVLDVVDNCPDEKGGAENAGCPEGKTSPEQGKSNIPTEGPVVDYLPLVLYFDNDQPDPNTNATTTKQAYLPLYVEYYKRKRDYIKQYTAGLGKEAITAATDSLENFFEGEVREGWNNLFAFSETLSAMLERGDKIELSLRACTGPGAASIYQNLAKRRISSVVNHFLTLDGGVYKTFMDSGQLTIKQELKESNIAPKAGAGSLYSPEAARQNRVEIIAVEVKGKSKN